MRSHRVRHDWSDLAAAAATSYCVAVAVQSLSHVRLQCMCTLYFVILFTCWLAFGLFWLLGCCAMNICEQVYIWTPVFNLGSYICRSWIIGWYVILYLIYWGITYFPECTILYFNQQCMSVLISPCPHQHFLFHSFKKVLAILVDLKWYLQLWFRFAFPWWLMTLSNFSCAPWSFIPLFFFFWSPLFILSPLLIF